MIEIKWEPIHINLDWWPETQKEWAPILLKDQQPYWKDERNPTSGRPWKKLSPDYAAWKKRNYPGQPIERLTGVMQDTAKIFPSNKGFNATVAYYGVYQQYGTSRMPARPWLGIPPSSLVQLAQLAFKNIFLSKR